METGVPLNGRRPHQTAVEAPGCFLLGISPGTAAEDPASGRTPAPGTEPDRKINIVLLCLVFLNIVLFDILGYGQSCSISNRRIFSRL